MSKVIFLPVVGYEGLYEISNTGVIVSLARYTEKIHRHEPKRIMKQNKDKNGYPYCELSKNGTRIKQKTHRLVATAFIPNPEQKPQVNHINHVKDDNRVENLEWCTGSENVKYSFQFGGRVFTRKMAQHAASYSAKVNSRKVWMCTLSGEKIKLFNSVKDARREIGGNPGSVLEGRCKHCKGYFFQYA